MCYIGSTIVVRQHGSATLEERTGPPQWILFPTDSGYFPWISNRRILGSSSADHPSPSVDFNDRTASGQDILTKDIALIDATSTQP
jgi:hypothetical protein